MSVNDGDVLEASARGEFGGIDDVVNVFQFRLSSGGTMDDQAAADDIIEILEIIYALINGAITALQLYRDITIRNVSQGTVLGTHSWATLTTGGSAGEAMPPGTCGVVNFGTPIPRLSPRKYFGVFTEVSNEPDGTWNATLTAALALAGARMLLPFAQTNGTWQYGTIRSADGLFYVPGSFTVNDIPGYQRRRKQGRGS